MITIIKIYKAFMQFLLTKTHFLDKIKKNEKRRCLLCPDPEEAEAAALAAALAEEALAAVLEEALAAVLEEALAADLTEADTAALAVTIITIITGRMVAGSLARDSITADMVEAASVAL